MGDAAEKIEGVSIVEAILSTDEIKTKPKTGNGR